MVGRDGRRVGDRSLRGSDEMPQVPVPEPTPAGGTKEGTVVVAIALGEGGAVGPRWGRAQRVAVATLEHDRLSSWDEIEVGWDRAREEGSDRRHHARVARFVKQHGVGVVVARHMGDDMLAMLGRMGVQVQLPTSDDARQAVRAAARPAHSRVLTLTGRDDEAGGRT